MSNQNDNLVRVLRYVGMMFVLVPLFIGAASATTWYVDDDGGAGINFTQIQEAVDAAQDNDTIIVYNGTYEENVVLKKSLTLQGEDRENTIIDNSSGNGVQIANDNCVIRGLTIRSCEDSGITIYSSSNNTISNSIITLNGRHGISFHNSSDNTIINNSIYSNYAKGISLHHHSNNNTIANNTVHSIIGGSDCDAIEVTISSYNVISDNEIFNCDDEGIELDGSSHNTITSNTIYSNTEVGIDVRGSVYNYIVNNTIHSNGDDGIALGRSWDTEPIVWGSSYNTITSNIIYSNGGDGIKLKNNSSNNQIYHNNLIYNDDQASDEGINNTWDNGPIIGGNYWSDHECVGNPSDGSQPYYIDANSTDYYPFEDTIGEFPPLPPPVPKTEDVFINKVERLRLYTSDTYYFIDHTQTYNFDTEWNVGVWDVKNLDHVTYTITTSKDLIYKDIWNLYKNGLSETNSTMPFSHIGENYTGVLPLEDRFASCVDFYLSKKLVQDNPWADIVVNTMAEGDYTRLNVTIVPRILSVSGDLTISGKIIDFTYPTELEVDVFFPDYRISFYGDLEDWNQGQSYNFTILVDELNEVELWLDKAQGEHKGGIEYSDRLTLPVSELGSVTVAYDVPVKWGYGIPQPSYTQSIQLCFKR